MKKKYMFVVFIFCACIIFAQDIKQTIKLKNNEAISNIYTLHNYTVISTQSDLGNNHKNYQIYVFDDKGNEIIKKTNLNIIPNQVFISSKKDVIVIMHGGEYLDDIIKSFNITTGDENWVVKTNAYSYTLSPNGSRLLTQAEPMGKEGKIQIVDLKDGTIENINLDINMYASEWLDNQRIVFLKYIVKEKRKKIFDEQEKAINRINLKIKELNEIRRKGLITQQEYIKRVSVLLNEKSGVIHKRRSLSNKEERRRTRSLHNNLEIERAYELLIYNAKTKVIENKKSPNNMSGKIKIPTYGSDINVISIDLKQNIYISGYSNKKRVLLKFNKKLEQIGHYTFDKYSKISCFRDNEKLLFRLIKNGQDIKILDEQIGKFRQLNNNDRYVKEIINLNPKMNYSKLTNNIRISDDLKTIKFISNEVEK